MGVFQMDDQERSIDFLHHHMEVSFQKVMEEYLVMDIDWLEDGTDSFRAVARMSGANKQNKECNILCLFPPFFPEDTNKK